MFFKRIFYCKFLYGNVGFRVDRVIRKREKEERIKADAVVRDKLLAALAAEEEKARSDTKKGLQ